MATRRDMLWGASALGLAALIPEAAEAASRSVAGYRPQYLPPTHMFATWLKRLHDFGPIRFTGTPPCLAFEDYLAAEFEKLGCMVERDRFRLTSWECDLERDCAISVEDDGGSTHGLEALSYYPFCASTRGRAPARGRILHGGTGLKGALALMESTAPEVLRDAIVVVDAPVGEISGSLEIYPGSEIDNPLRETNAPMPAAAIFHRGLMAALQDRCRGIVLCFTDVNDDAARYTWAPFSEPHGKVPALWVGAESGHYLRSVTGRATMDMRCDATLIPDARADSLLATLPGQTDEVVLLTTHTDGPNECNDNGALGLLALATYASKLPLSERRRTLVFSMPTGHYAMGAVADPVTGSGRRAGTYGMMKSYPTVIERTVAQIALEQLGALEWDEVDGGYQPTGRAAPSFWLPTNDHKSIFSSEPVHGTQAMGAAMVRMFAAASADGDPKYLRGALVESGFAPGEGGALRAAGIPGIGLMGVPGYFFRADPRGVLDKLDARVMRAQVSVAARLLSMMDRLTIGQLQGTETISNADLYGV